MDTIDEKPKVMSNFQARMFGTMFGPVLDPYIKKGQLRAEMEADGNLKIRARIQDKDGGAVGALSLWGNFKVAAMEYLASRNCRITEADVKKMEQETEVKTDGL